MRKIEQAMLRAIADCPPDRSGRIFSGGNTVVTRWHEGIHGTIGYDAGFSVKLYNTEIARWSSYDPSSVLLNHGGYRTVTTKSRICVMLHYLYGSRFGLFQEDYKWFVAEYGTSESRPLLRKLPWDEKQFLLDSRRCHA